MIDSRWRGAVAGAAVALAGCSAEASSAGPRDVTISWAPSHEKGVNGPGGGYRVTIDAAAPVDLPWPGPTSLTMRLGPGGHLVAVQAYEPDPGGPGTAVSPAATLQVVVR